MNPILSASLFGGLCALDNRTSLKLLFSQPICSGAIIGLILGSPAAGFLAGALFQMMFLGVVTLRGEKNPDLTLGGVTAASLFILVSRHFGEDPVLGGLILVLSLLVALGVSYLGSRAYTLWESYSYRLSVFALSNIGRGRRTAASVAHLATVMLHFLFGFVLLFVVLVVVRFVLSFLLTVFVREGGSLDLFYLLPPFIGIGSLVRFHIKKMHIFWFGAGFLVVYVLFLTRG